MSLPPPSPPERGDPGRVRRRGARGIHAKPGPALVTSVVLFVLVVLAVLGLFLYRYLTAEVFFRSATSRDSIASGASPEISLTNSSGSVRVEAVRGRRSIEYEVTGYGAGRSEALAEERAAEVEAVVELREPDGDSPSEVTIETSGGEGADYRLRVPPGSGVEVRSGAGPVEVSGVAGSTRVEADAGDVAVRDASGSVEVVSGAGDVLVEGVTAETESVEVAADSGDVSLSDLVIATLDVEVASGGVTLGGRFAGEGEVSVKTGDVRVEVPPEDARNVAFRTSVGEVIRSDEEEN